MAQSRNALPLESSTEGHFGYRLFAQGLAELTLIFPRVRTGNSEWNLAVG